MQDLSGNAFKLAAGWGHLAAQPALKHLRLRGCGLEFLPDQLAALAGLTHLDVSYNPLAWPAGWAPLGNMPALRRLTASRLPTGLRLELLTAAELVHSAAEEDEEGWMQ